MLGWFSLCYTLFLFFCFCCRSQPVTHNSLPKNMHFMYFLWFSLFFSPVFVIGEKPETAILNTLSNGVFWTVAFTFLLRWHLRTFWSTVFHMILFSNISHFFFCFRCQFKFHTYFLRIQHYFMVVSGHNRYCHLEKKNPRGIFCTLNNKLQKNAHIITSFRFCRTAYTAKHLSQFC